MTKDNTQEQIDKNEDQVNKKLDDKKTSNQDYEIDLGQVFGKIGKGIGSMFISIFDLAKFSFLQIVIFTLFLKKNALKLAIGTAIGLIFGIALQYYSSLDKKYESSMTLSPNFGSTLQLYKSVEMFQSLIDLENYDALAQKLNISKEDAESLISFEVEPFLSNIEKVKAYQGFLSLADSITETKFPFDDYFENVSVIDYGYHIITVVSRKENVFKQLKDPILASIISNKYFARIKETSYKNLVSKKANLEVSKLNLDTLGDFYKELLILNAQKETNGSGTNIFMANQQAESNKELIVFNKYMNIDNEILDITRAITNEKRIVNVISSFNEFGSKIKNSYIKWGVIDGFLLTLLILLMIEANYWMVDYVRNNIKQK